MPPEGQGFVVVTEGSRTPVLEGAPVVSADEYLEGVTGTLDAGLVVVNLCRSYQYLSKGYYVSLLADARRQSVFPTLKTIEEARNATTCLRALRAAGVPVADARTVRELRRAARAAATPVPALALAMPAAPPSESPAEPSAAPDLPESGYAEAWSVFGTTVDPRFRAQCEAAFRACPFPLLRMRFYRDRDEWKAAHLAPVSLGQLDPSELRLLETALRGGGWRANGNPVPRLPLRRIACLWDAQDAFAASDRDTLDRFARVAAERGLSFECIGFDDLPRLAEYDALFIRTVTAIDHPSFAFAQMAESLGMPVLDDPQSILRCTNKVFMHELFARNGVSTPRTATISRRTCFEVARTLGLPLIVKSPDGSFSQSVKKADTLAQFDAITQDMFRRSPLLIVQEFTPTLFDWRIGVLENRLLFAAKYHMATGHWQIVTTSGDGEREYGLVEAVPIEAVPPRVKSLALSSAALMGDGLYGVDVKETAAGPVVIEVNDNPSIHEGYEDASEGDRLYASLLDVFARRMHANAVESA